MDWFVPPADEDMVALEGPAKWKNIGHEGCQLWKDIRAFLVQNFSYRGLTWQENYSNYA